jgi:4a-hydroxytetrahydrobiopterin dehydratase
MDANLGVVDAITPRLFRASPGVDDWRVVGDGANAFYRTAGFDLAARLIGAIAAEQSLAARPPAIDLRADGVTLRLVTTEDGYFGLTRRDADAAARISTVARDLGVAADPSAIQAITIIPGAADVAAVQPFWRAILGYEGRPDTPDEDLIDPRGRGPSLWLETMETPRAEGGGAIHVCVWVPREQAEERVAAALAAGGRLVRDASAPSWWTLADRAGNEADIATTGDS